MKSQNQFSNKIIRFSGFSAILLVLLQISGYSWNTISLEKHVSNEIKGVFVAENNTLFVGTEEQIYKMNPVIDSSFSSSGFGKTLELLHPGPFGFASTNDTIYVGASDMLLGSFDNGDSWEILPVPNQSILGSKPGLYHMQYELNQLWVGLELHTTSTPSHGFVVVKQPGSDWEIVGVKENQDVYAGSITDINKIFVSENGIVAGTEWNASIYSFQDSTWTKISPLTGDEWEVVPEYNPHFNVSDVVAVDSTILVSRDSNYSFTLSPQTVISLDWGKTWKETGLPSAKLIKDESTIYALTEMELFFSENKGESWIQVSLPAYVPSNNDSNVTNSQLLQSDSHLYIVKSNKDILWTSKQEIKENTGIADYSPKSNLMSNKKNKANPFHFFHINGKVNTSNREELQRGF